MERRSLEVQGLARFSNALLPGAKAAEVLGSLWDHVGAQRHLDAARGGATNGHIEENDWVGHCFGFVVVVTRDVCQRKQKTERQESKVTPAVAANRCGVAKFKGGE